MKELDTGTTLAVKTVKRLLDGTTSLTQHGLYRAARDTFECVLVFGLLRWFGLALLSCEGAG